MMVAEGRSQAAAVGAVNRITYQAVCIPPVAWLIFTMCACLAAADASRAG
jgi:hypothetical protein